MVENSIASIRRNDVFSLLRSQFMVDDYANLCQKSHKVRWENGSKLRKVAENQHWQCPICGEHLLNGEKLHIHHLESVKLGGTDSIDNLVHLHVACHKYFHAGGVL